jgi:DNA-directed RNA polymerase specialized sigma24 family protein
MDNREIARALDRSDGATKVLIHRAIKQLEELVGARGDQDGATQLGAPIPHAGLKGPRR